MSRLQGPTSTSIHPGLQEAPAETLDVELNGYHTKLGSVQALRKKWEAVILGGDSSTATSPKSKPLRKRRSGKTTPKPSVSVKATDEKPTAEKPASKRVQFSDVNSVKQGDGSFIREKQLEFEHVRNLFFSGQHDELVQYLADQFYHETTSKGPASKSRSDTSYFDIWCKELKHQISERVVEAEREVERAEERIKTAGTLKEAGQRMMEMADALDALEQRLHNEAPELEKVEELKLEAQERVDQPISVSAFVKGISPENMEFEANRLARKIKNSPDSSSVPAWQAKLDELRFAIDHEKEKTPVTKDFNFQPDKEKSKASREKLADLREALGNDDIDTAKALIQKQTDVETMQLMTDTLKRGFYSPELIQFAQKHLDQLAASRK